MLRTEVKNYLLSLHDDRLLEFEQSLNMSIDGIKQIGIRMSLLRKYAKELSEKYELDYLINNIDEEYYEELMLKGIIIGCYKYLSFDRLEYYIKKFVPKIYDWGICDTFVVSLKIIKRYLDDVWRLVNNYLRSNNEFEVRFALVVLLNYYLNDDYIDKIYLIVDSINLDKYYVKMANAWLISYMLVKYFDRTINYLKVSKVDNWTYNKAIQKGIESYRLNNEQKEIIRKMKR